MNKIWIFGCLVSILLVENASPSFNQGAQRQPGFSSSVILTDSRDSLAGKVEYKVSMKKIPQSKLDSIDNDGALALLKNATDVPATLIFKGTEAVYTVDDIMKNDSNQGINITEIFAGGEKLYYHNSATQENIEKTATLGEVFLVTSESIKWELTSETKQIGEYLCYKAIPVDHKNTSAWFAPEIPISFGPRNYNGLPGLILELNVSNYVFKATSIDLSRKTVELEKPTEGKKVTREEYKEASRKALPGFFNEG